MLHTQTVEAGTLALIRRFMDDPQLSKFSLVGGTALALKIGHRKSIDIDLFAQLGYDAPGLAHHLTQSYGALVRQVRPNSIYCIVEGIKVDLVTHAYPMVGPVEAVDDIRMWSLPDLAAMKLNAIRDNGTRLKDYVDIYFLLEHQSLGNMLGFYGQKYGYENAHAAQLSLMYHQDIQFDVDVEFISKTIKWPRMAERLLRAGSHLDLIFRKPNNQPKRIVWDDNFRKRRGL